jgi:tetratricopeptide (TPR) repeat protein
MRWQQKSAETANRRDQLEEGRRQLLSRAYDEFQQLTEALQLAAQRDQLKPSGQSLVRNCVFEAAHTLYLLERYSEAISAYTTAVNRYPQDAQVLTAYLQMARCYNHLGKPAESRSLLEQARVILQHEQIPESSFLATSSSLSRTEWEAWLDRAGKIQP